MGNIRSEDDGIDNEYIYGMEASYEMCFVMYNEEMSSSRHMTCLEVKTNTYPDIYISR